MKLLKTREPGPPVNQRVSRPPVVSTTPRRGAVRRSLTWIRERFTNAEARKSFKSVVIRGTVSGVVIVAAIVGARWLEGYVRTSPVFSIADIQIEGNERLGQPEIAELTGIREGRNIFDVSPEVAKRQLEAHPWIAGAFVRRKLPRTYIVRLRERTAVALLALGELYLIGDDATVFKKLGVNDPSDFPIITGVDAGRFSSDRAFRTSLLLEIVSLLEEYASSGLAAQESLSEIHVEPTQELSLYTGRDGGYVRLGRGPYRQKLTRLRHVFSKLRASRVGFEYVYLDNERRPDRVTVKVR